MSDWDRDNIEIQMKATVCVTMHLSREDAESMYLHELRDILDHVLADGEVDRLSSRIDGYTAAQRVVPVAYKISPNWDCTPQDDMELTWTEEGLFPRDE